MVPPASDKISRVSPYSGSRWASSRFRIRDLHPLRSAFQCRSPTMILAVSRSFNPRPRSGLGSSPFARRYSGNHFCFLFLRVLRCFSSPGTSLMDYGFIHGCHPITDDGFPHSDIDGSLCTYHSPSRFAVCCVLLQFQVPRHPPYALTYLITSSCFCFRFA